MKVRGFGERASLFDLAIASLPPEARAARTLAAAAWLRERFQQADVVLGGGHVLLDGVAPTALSEVLIRDLQVATNASAHALRESPLVSLDVVYDGPDLEPVARALGVSIDEVVSLHSGQIYCAELIGFLPGFAYLGPVAEPLRLPRRASPRARVLPGSVAVAAGFTGVYPFASPGGWHLLGRAIGAPLFDPVCSPPSRITIGTQVRFLPVLASDVEPTLVSDVPTRSTRPPSAAFEVLRAPAAATIQDSGRAAMLSQGLPPSGPLDPETHARANLAVGNAASAAAVEIPLGALELRAIGSLLVSIDGAPAVYLRTGSRLTVPVGQSAVRYLAVAGGIDVPEVLGSRSTLLPIRIGGLAGRPLRRGDVVAVGLDVGLPPRSPSRDEPRLDQRDVLHVMPGPHLEAFPSDAWGTLLTQPFVVSHASDRVGVRLDGARLPTAGTRLALPVPMLRGAIEVSTDGTPIILGPDHPVTGGYPVIAVLTAASQAKLARLAPGAPARLASCV